MPLVFLAGMAVAIAGIRFIRLVDEFNSCEYEIVREFPSPNERLTAIVVTSACMLTPYYTSVVIKSDGEEFSFKNRDNYLFDIRDKRAIEVLWDGNNALTIVHAHPDEIYRKVVIWYSIPITYREKP